MSTESARFIEIVEAYVRLGMSREFGIKVATERCKEEFACTQD